MCRRRWLMKRKGKARTRLCSPMSSRFYIERLRGDAQVEEAKPIRHDLMRHVLEETGRRERNGHKVRSPGHHI